jgi:hypothetical protein
MKKAIVETIIRQEIDVPDEADQQEVLNFLTIYQSFRDAFVGISDVSQSGWRITDVQVMQENVLQLDEEVFDN